MRGDDRLRALERRYRETGTVEDEAAWLRERVRAGELSAERIVLAARFGHPAALAFVTLGGEAEPGDLNRRVEALILPGEVEGAPTRVDREFVTQACVRIGLACAWVIGDIRRLWLRPAEDAALKAAEDWALCPCPPHALHAGSAAAAASWTKEYPGLRIHTLPGMVAELTGTSDPRHAGLLAASCLRRAASSLGRSDRLVDIVRESLLPWALGQSDPVLARQGAAPEPTG